MERYFVRRTDRTIRDLYVRPITIRVHNIGESSVEAAEKRSTPLIESALFEVAYLKRVAYQVVDNWPTPVRLSARDRFSFGERLAGFNLPFPRARFNPDLVRFYQLGAGSDIPVLQFLAFYQVLEYFFVSISDQRLYTQLAKRINDPRFATVARQLDRLIQDVVSHRRMSDESEMLKMVLMEYVDKDELRTFVEEYQGHLGDKLYTKKRTRFGVECQVNLESDSIYADVAKVVKTVRNALVHSSDRYERQDRHIPFSKNAEVVRLEVPLVKFLAERIIVASADGWGAG